MDWKQLIELAAPAVGGIATGDPGQSGAFMHAFQQEQLRQQQEKQRQAQLQQQQQRVGADFLLNIGQHAESFDDPVALDNFLRLAEDAGTKAGYVTPGEVRGRFQVSPTKQASKKLAELTDLLAGFEKNGYNLDELAQSGAHVQLKDGSDLPISAAIDLTRKRPTSATGSAIPAPKKADVAASTDYSRFLAKYAKDRGKTVDQLTSAEELDAKKQFGQADDKTPTGPSDFTSRYLDNLVAVWKQGHPGEEPPASVMTQLMRQAKKDIGQADDKPTGTGINPYQEFNVSERLAKAWTDTTKAAREMDRQYSLMQTGLQRFRKGDKNGGSQAVLVTFQKILDPTSVVRESEYARSAEGISLLNRMQGWAEKLEGGGAGVTGADLAAMVETARQFVDNMKRYTVGQRSRIEAQVKKYKLDPVTVFDDVLTGAAGGGGGAASGPARVYYDANGNPK